MMKCFQKTDSSIFLILAFPFIIGGAALLSLLDGINYFEEIPKIKKNLEGE